MLNPDYCYVDTALGNLGWRNKPLLVTAVKSSVPQNQRECYCTWHRFPKLYADRCDQLSSVKGYDGPSYSDFLPFDFDAENLKDAHTMVLEFMAYLEADFDVTYGYRCYFSGSKGFHVHVSAELFGGWAPSRDLAGTLRKLALRLSDDIDTAVYDRNRLWRMVNTINDKSGLYKIPLGLDEIQTHRVDDIVELAKGPRELDYPDWSDVGVSEACQRLLADVSKVEKPQFATTTDLFSTNLQEGQGRDVAAFNLACRMRDWGVPSDAALQMLRFWNSQLKTPLTTTDGADILEKKIYNAYGETENGDRISARSIRSIGDLAGDYTVYVEMLKRSRVRLGYPKIDNLIRFAPGEVMTVMAKTSVGKTAMAQNVLRNVASDGVQALFCSMEQPGAQVYERWAQMAFGRDGKEIERGWADGEYRQTVVGELQQRLGGRVWVCDVPNMKLDEVRSAYHQASDKANKPMQVVVIDYLGLLDTKQLDRTLYGRVSEAARAMKTLAKELNVCLINLCQISRTGEQEDGAKPLHISSARESGAIEESCDYLLGLYRPGLKQVDRADDEMVIQILKNRKGGCGSVKCNFEGRTLTITECIERDTSDPLAPQVDGYQKDRTPWQAD